MTEQQRRGQAFYLRGVSAAGQDMTARLTRSGITVPSSVMPCVNCHGHEGEGGNEGGVTTSDIRRVVLKKPYANSQITSRRHTGYREESDYKKAIGMGVDPAGNQLNAIMPRYELTHGVMQDLTAYLRGLGEFRVPGIEPDTIRLGYLVTKAASHLNPAITATVRALVDSLNARGGIYQRRIELVFFDSVSEFETWEEDGDKPVFALFASHIEGAEDTLERITREHHIPILGAFTPQPVVGQPLNPYIFYLLPGEWVQIRAIVDHVSSLADAEVAYAAFDTTISPDTMGALAGRFQVLTADNVNVFVSGNRSADHIVYAGPDNMARRLLHTMIEQGSTATMWITSEALSERFLETAAGYDEPVNVSMSVHPQDFGRAGWQIYEQLQAEYQLPEQHIATQLKLIANAILLEEALTRAGRDLTRARFVSELEGLYKFNTGLMRPITFSSNRRLGIAGAYLVPVASAHQNIPRPLRWVEVEL